MNKYDGIGYLIPDQQPDQLRCVRVYIPDDPLYLAALLGSITYLGTWAAWERDELHRGRLAALAWKDANERTLDELSTGCDGNCPDCPDCDLCDMTADELRQLIAEELEKMTINITNNVGCGCGCGCGCGATSTGGADTTPVDNPVPDPENYPPGEDPGTNQSPNQKCSMANYFVYTIRLGLLHAVTYDGNHPGYNSFLRSLWDGVRDHVEDWLDDLSYGLYSWIMAQLNGDATATSRITDIFDQHYNYYVCQLFNAESEQEAYYNLYYAFVGTLSQDEPVMTAAQDLASVLPFGLLFANSGAINIPAGFENRECCGETQEDVEPYPEQPLEDGWVWVYPPDNSFEYTIDDGDEPLAPSYSSLSLTFRKTEDKWFNYNINFDLGGLYDGDRVQGLEFIPYAGNGVMESFFIVRNGLVASGPDLNIGPNDLQIGSKGFIYIGDISGSGVDLSVYDVVDSSTLVNDDNWFGFLSWSNQTGPATLTASIRFLVHLGDRA
jgi:hypothetical protein